MLAKSFKALWVTEKEDGTFHREIKQIDTDRLPLNECLIEVKYSALNYKDALSSSGHKGITRNFPHIPGIDAVGTVVESKGIQFSAGDEVIVTSYDLGMNTFGAFSQYIRVPEAWIVPKPKNFDMKYSMVLGTAAFTAGLALYKMEQNGQDPDMGPVLVTGATGGVGSMAVALLNHAGYEVIASTGNQAAHDDLRKLGATSIIDRSDVYDPSDKPFRKTAWAGAIDTVGGVTLATILKACGHNGNVATCGLVESAELATTVYPFIIKGNNLLGVESAECRMGIRKEIWNKLANEWCFSFPEEFIEEISLEELNATYIDKILAGNTKGRVVVNPNL